MSPLIRRRPCRVQMSEAFLTMVFISASGGLQDAYTYIQRDQVFANAQTGNIVLLSQKLFAGDWLGVLHYLMPLLSFAAGVAVTEFIRFRCQKTIRLHWRQLVLLAEILLLFLVGFIPDLLNPLANAMVSFSCAMQVQAFRKVDGCAFASTMCIGNLRSGVESLCAYGRTRNPQVLREAARYFGVILLFALGAGIGGACVPALGQRTIWLSCGLLLISFCMMFIREESEASLKI